jgi:hydroxymethylpyrimidine/phosphomethylpyrimidine kinase
MELYMDDRPQNQTFRTVSDGQGKKRSLPEPAEYPSLAMALTIATTDSGGGAGIQADLKTFAALGVFGLSCISAVSAQNSREVTALECLSPQTVTAQLEAIFSDMPPQAIKIGLIGNVENARAIKKFLAKEKKDLPVILDPVMVSQSGHIFLDQDSVEALKELFPLADLITPNIPETIHLTGLGELGFEKRFDRAAEILLTMGAQAVLIKGGHGTSQDITEHLYLPSGTIRHTAQRLDSPNTHGTGCSLSSAIAALMASGRSMEDAVWEAREYVRSGIAHGLRPGLGPGCLNHFHPFYRYKDPIAKHVPDKGKK